MAPGRMAKIVNSAPAMQISSQLKGSNRSQKTPAAMPMATPVTNAMATDTTPAANLQLSAKGDLEQMQLDLAGRAPEPLSLSLDLRGDDPGIDLMGESA